MRAFIILLLLFPAAVLADDQHLFVYSLVELGVRVEKPAGDGKHFSQGSGVFLGDGLVLTAAHVVKVDPGNRKVTVLLDGWRRDGTLVADGQTENIDLALIKIPSEELDEKRRTQAPVAICAGNPGPSQPVVVASLGTLSNAVTVSTPITSDLQMGSWTNLLSTGYHQGNSGGGVFDPRHGCLWGILNMELSGPSKTDGRFLDLTAFVPASKITQYLDAYHRQANGDQDGSSGKH
jgi:hypothetical protein